MNEATRQFLASRIPSEESQRHAEDLLEELEQEDEGVDASGVLDQAMLSAAHRFDPAATLSAWLSARFSGAQVTDGALDAQIAEAVLGPLRAEIQGAASSKSVELARIELVGVSRGSAVLHFEPAVAVVPTADGQMDASLSVIDGAIGKVMAVHDQLEDQAVAARIATAPASLLSATKRLVSALDKYELDLDLSWKSPLGRTRQSRLSAVGRSHAARLFDEVKSSEEVVIGGRVTELSASGKLKIKQGVSAGREVFFPSEHRELLQSFHLGQHVLFRVDREKLEDRVGLRGDESFTFIEQVSELRLEPEAE